ncbi:unnamed protein product [[Candida] boidinii]|nr:unnamed protein product [[Candida] boidinii]
MHKSNQNNKHKNGNFNITDAFDDDVDEDTDDDGSNDTVDIDRIEGHKQTKQKRSNSIFSVPQNVRNLMVVRSCNSTGGIKSDFNSIISESSGLIKGSVHPKEILIELSQMSYIELENHLLTVLNQKIFDIIPLKTIISDCLFTGFLPIFADLDPKGGVSLRNFNIQVSKISHISDFVVYCFNEDHSKCIEKSDDLYFLTSKSCKCASISKLLTIAQILYQESHPELVYDLKKAKPSLKDTFSTKMYNTFVLQNPDTEALEKSNILSIPILNFRSSLKSFSDLCSDYDLKVFNDWDSNYLYREKLEISKMSSATHVSHNIWFGNITDCECLQIQSNNYNKEHNSKDLNTASTEIKIPTNAAESIEDINKNGERVIPYCDPKNTIVTLTKADFENQTSKVLDAKLITFPKSNWKFFVHCVEGARFPPLELLSDIFKNMDKPEQIFIEFPPSGSVSIAGCSDDYLLSIVNLCKLLYLKCGSDFTGLLYCSDGYTETSLLGLSLLIMLVSKELVDPYLMKIVLLCPNSESSNTVGTSGHYGYHAQLDSGSSTITTSTGTHIVQLRGRARNYSNASTSSSSSVGSVGSVGSVMNSQGVKSVSASSRIPNTSLSNSRFGKPITQSVENSSTKIFEHYQAINKDAESDKNNLYFGQIDTHSSSDCFTRLFGSLPSRILPHLYLGSLEHASSLPLLRELGINFIVSVGETIGWLEDLEYVTETTESGCEILKILPGQKDANGYRCYVEQVMKISNINDDGIGTLTTTINDALEFIETGYKKNGRALVHCQVGVSRSATVCIAEVMKRLNISLPRAYLFVRVRRLNVIIQPNLKLMYELFKWEESFVSEKLRKRAIKNNQVDILTFTNGNLSSSSSVVTTTVSVTNTRSNSNSHNVSDINLHNGIPFKSTRTQSMTSTGSNATASSIFSESSSSSPSSSFSTSTRGSTSSAGIRKALINAPLQNIIVEENDVFADDDDDPLSTTASETTQTDTVKFPFRSETFVPPSSIVMNSRVGSRSYSNPNSSFATVELNNMSINSSQCSTIIPSPEPASLQNESYLRVKKGRLLSNEYTLSPKTSVDYTIQEPLIISNNPTSLREVDWCILCREIYNLNRAYIKPF